MKTETLKHERSLVLINANLVMIDGYKPDLHWIAIKGNKIENHGEGGGWASFVTKTARVIDCRGRTVLPGFIDPHFHLVSFAKSLVTIDLQPANNIRSISDIQARLRTYARFRPRGSWIRGRGYDEFHLTDKRHPDRRDLDKAASDYPIKLTHRSGHAQVLNSLALQLAGISKNTPDPPGGMIERNLSDGEPTGLLFEMSDFLSKRIPAIDGEAFEQGLQMANHQLLSMGITTIQDASSGNNWGRWKRFKAFHETGLVSSSINMMIGFSDFKNIKQWYDLKQVEQRRLKVTTVKIVLDETTGRLYPNQQELNKMVMKVHVAGFQVAIHAIEENAIEAACAAIEYALKKKPEIDHRHRIEHCSVCPPALAKRIARSNILVVTQPAFIYYNGERYRKTVPDRQLKYLYPIKTLLNQGVQVAGSSDCPIVSPNPLTAIYAAVTRMDKMGALVGANEKVPLVDALYLYTRNAARVMFEERIKGTIARGKMADLVVLDANPGQLKTDEIKDLNVDMTIVNGKVVWQR